MKSTTLFILLILCGAVFPHHSYIVPIIHTSIQKEKRAEVMALIPNMKNPEKEGVYVYVSDENNWIETYLCNKKAFNYGVLYQFGKKGFCSRGLIPLKNLSIFELRRVKTDYITTSPWKAAYGNDRVLLYREDKSYTAGLSSQGNIVREIQQDRFIDEQGNSVYPSFVYDGEKWESQLPQRELFLFDLASRFFRVEIFTAGELPKDKETLSLRVGLHAKSYDVVRRNHSTAVIYGENLNGIRFPAFLLSDGNEAYRGRYTIMLNYKKDRKKQHLTFSENGVHVVFKSGNTGYYLDIKIESELVERKTVEKIIGLYSTQMPSFYIRKHDE